MKKTLLSAMVLIITISMMACNNPRENEPVINQVSVTSQLQNTAEPINPPKPEQAVDTRLDLPEPTECPDIKLNATDRAREILNGMTIDEKIGQMFIARCPSENAPQKAADYHLGGYILFRRDFQDKTPDEVVSYIQQLQSAACIPMFIGVDEEGGTVNRVSNNPLLRSNPFLSSQDLYRRGGFDLIRSDAREKSNFLKGFGINLNFSPVCDISQNPDDYIFDRSFGSNSELTSEYVKTVVQAMKAEGMGSVLKHFPGYGNNSDTHEGIALDERPAEVFWNSDFIPFKTGISAGADMVLVSHNVVSCFDKDNPASLSPKIHALLRNDLGFDGVIITDDLYMKGVSQYADAGQIAVMAVIAGNDMLCCSDFEHQISAVQDAVAKGVISQKQIDEAVYRIISVKLSLGICK